MERKRTVCFLQQNNYMFDNIFSYYTSSRLNIEDKSFVF